MGPMTTTTRRLIAGVLLVAATAGPLAGCGDDEDTEASGATTEAEGSTETSEEASGETTEAPAEGEALCEPYVELVLAFSSEEPPDPEALNPLVDTVEAEAPDDLADPVGVIVAAARTALDSGGEDFSAFEAPEFTEATGEVDPFIFESCDFDTKVETTAVDYAFEGIPDELTAGQAAFLLTNEGTEAHEIGVFRKVDGVTETFDEIFAATDDEESRDLVERVAGTFAPMNGSTGLAIADLEPGDYAAVCFIPVGTTVDETGETEGTGAPHFTEGMVHEFTVTG